MGKKVTPCVNANLSKACKSAAGGNVQRRLPAKGVRHGNEFELLFFVRDPKGLHQVSRPARLHDRDHTNRPTANTALNFELDHSWNVKKTDMAHQKSVGVIGAGIVGISTAYYLARHRGVTDITLIDRAQPMGFTSAQSGENYRNWWPHPTMVAFTNRSIDLMEDIARGSGNRINMTRRGYALATRETNIDALVGQLHDGLQEDAQKQLRFHQNPQAKNYTASDSSGWEQAADGVDVLQNQDLIHSHFPSYGADIQSLVHIRRGGDISGQQLGSYMLEFLRSVGCKRLIGTVQGIENGKGYTIKTASNHGLQTVHADGVVNAAGPFAGEIAQMLGVDLLVTNTFQQKIAFEDHLGLVPRTMPFSIDLDAQAVDWTEDERAMLLADPEHAWLAEQMPGSIHCRPDGGDAGKWVKLGWAYNDTAAKPTWEQPLDRHFPDIVLRGASRLNPGLKRYYGRLPRNMHHYGGWYTLTEENWPLIGPMGPEGSYMNCAMSGFGTMAACASGSLCADWIVEAELPSYAHNLSIDRKSDPALMKVLMEASKGIL